MFKKILCAVLCALMLAACLAGCGTVKTTFDSDCGVEIATKYNVDADFSYITGLEGKSLKVGVISIGDETDGYSIAHINAINEAVELIKNAGGNVEVTWKKNTPEDSPCDTAVQELASQNMDIIITNSYGHQYHLGETTVQDNPNTAFICMTADLAAASGLANYKNAFTNIYEARYVGGVVAGLKLKQLVEDNLVDAKNIDADGNIKLGYVGAFNYAEVVSGYTAFFLGVQSVVSNVAMHVQYTNSWSNYDSEKSTADALIAEGCLIISQHSNTEAAATACEEAFMNGTRVYSVGYNVDMRTAAPHAALVSSQNNWVVYYAYAFYTAMTAGPSAIDTDRSSGFKYGGVSMSDINGVAFKEDPSAQVKTVIDSIANGTLKVFDTSKFTVWDEATQSNIHLTSYTGSWGMNGQETMKTENGVTYFDESVLRSAPYFDIRITGITETGAAQ